MLRDKAKQRKAHHAKATWESCQSVSLRGGRGFVFFFRHFVSYIEIHFYPGRKFAFSSFFWGIEKAGKLPALKLRELGSVHFRPCESYLGAYTLSSVVQPSTKKNILGKSFEISKSLT